MLTMFENWATNEQCHSLYYVWYGMAQLWDGNELPWRYISVVGLMSVLVNM